MATYSDWQQRRLDSDPAHDKRQAAVPTQGFDAWLRDELAQQAADDVAELIDEGWLEADAIAFIANSPRDAGWA